MAQLIPLPTVLLSHTTGEGHHYDWLIANPLDPAGPLWTARIAIPSDQWAGARRCALTPLPPHRRRYLTYQGPLTRGRGSVQRIDHGEAICEEWTENRILLRVAMQNYIGMADIVAQPSGDWWVTFEA